MTSATEPLARLEFTELHDADQLDQLLVDWRIHSLQLDRGRHRLITERVMLADLVLERNLTNVAKLDEYRIPANSTLFVFPKPGMPRAHWCGLEIPDDVVLLNRSSREHFAVMPPDYETVTLLVSNHVLVELGMLPDEQIDNKEASTGAIIPVRKSDATRFRHWLFNRFGSERGLQLLSRDRDAACRFRQQVLFGLGCLIDEGLEVGTNRCVRTVRRSSVVKRACQMVSERILESLSVPRMSKDLGVSQRMLERGFAEVLRMTPHAYIRVCKLNSVRRELRRSPRHATTVSRVALKYGFTELGRFSLRYRQLFDELPSETLNSGTRMFRAGSLKQKSNETRIR